MKFFKWKTFIITSIVCLLPMLLGLSLWDKLPDTIAIHFNFHGEADNFASKNFVVLGLPVLMVILQGICCFTNDFNSYKHGEIKKLENVTKWIIPVITVVLYIATLVYALGFNLDMRKVAVFILGVVFLLIGNCMKKLDYVKNYDLEPEKARKINRFIGYETVMMGLLFLISLFLPSEISVACLFLLIPFTIISVVYGVIVARK